MTDKEWFEDYFARIDVREENKADWDELLSRLHRAAHESVETRIQLLEAQHQWVLEELGDILLVLEIMNSR